MTARPWLPVLLALSAAACGTGNAVQAGHTAAPEPVTLVNSEWRLVEYTLPGHAPVPVRVSSTLYLRDGTEFTATACNGTGGQARVDGTHVDFGTGSRVSTDMACHGEAAEVQAAFGAVTRGVVDWATDGRLLSLHGPGGTLTYEPFDVLHPVPGTVTVAEGTRDGWRYRLYAGAGPVESIALAVVDAAGRPAGGSSLATPAPNEPAMLGVGEVAGTPYVYVFAPEKAVRVTHQPTADGPVVELTRYDLPGSRWPVFAGFVPAHHNGRSLTAYDADGRELAPWTGW
ncbi:MAG TPA: META domain-containing protein [Mycobacteriales bacterium]|jgi:heat shock protein HslJ|nr:META domain-containing protein [Mycobacteriales bacterium]